MNDQPDSPSECPHGFVSGCLECLLDVVTGMPGVNVIHVKEEGEVEVLQSASHFSQPSPEE